MKRITIFLAMLLSVLVGVACWQLSRHEQKQTLNLQLIGAIRREERAAVLTALEHGANANACPKPEVSPSERFWSIVRGYKIDSMPGPPPLLISMQPWHDRQGRQHIPREDLEITGALLAHGADANVVYPDRFASYRITPLLAALSLSRPATARLLVEHGADVNAESGNEPLLHLAIQKRDASLVEQMLQHRADANRPNGSGQTPLGCALYYHDAPLVQILLRYHADPNTNTVVDDRQFSTHPLKFAADHNLTEITKILRNAGAR